MPKLTKPFQGVKEGEIYPTDFAPGDECPPELQAAAESLGALGQPKKPASQSDGGVEVILPLKRNTKGQLSVGKD